MLKIRRTVESRYVRKIIAGEKRYVFDYRESIHLKIQSINQKFHTIPKNLWVRRVCKMLFKHFPSTTHRTIAAISFKRWSIVRVRYPVVLVLVEHFLQFIVSTLYTLVGLRCKHIFNNFCCLVGFPIFGLALTLFPSLALSNYSMFSTEMINGIEMWNARWAFVQRFVKGKF